MVVEECGILRYGYVLDTTSVYRLWWPILRRDTDERTSWTRCAIGGGSVLFAHIQASSGPSGAQPLLQIQAQPRDVIAHYGDPHMLGSVE